MIDKEDKSIIRGRYQIIAELGRGGMSEVYLAKDLKLESYWALKRVKNDNSVDIDAFKKEVELLSSLSHPDIPRIVDKIEIDDYYYVIMDFIDGISLKKKVQTEGIQQEKQIVDWAIKLCDILTYLHTVREIPIIYRDMKPDNVMLTQDGRIKLIDFGIAKECRRNEKQMGIGTPGYASPEQYGGASNILDERSDIYSLGATLFYLTTNLTPQRPPNGIPLIRNINQNLSEGLEYIIQKCTRDNPDDRYNNCYELLNDLNNIEKMTGNYRKRLRRKLISFMASIAALLFSLMLMFVGINGMEKIRKYNYVYYYTKAEAQNRKGNVDRASDYYLKAISYSESNTDTYIEYFKTLLPADKDSKYEDKLISAVNTMKNSYIDNSKSDMYQNTELMYLVAKQCMEISDAGYISYVADYIKKLNERNYKSEEILPYKIISENLSKNFEKIDFKDLYEGLIKLEEVTDNDVSTIDNKLNNYYILIKAYAQYPQYIGEQCSEKNKRVVYAYDKIESIGEKARKCIEENDGSEDMKFGGIIRIHENVASNLCNEATKLQNTNEKHKAFLKAKKWFDYLEDYGVDSEMSLRIKKANMLSEIYETSENRLDNIQMLNAAIKEYEGIRKTFDYNFLTEVYYTEALLNKEEILEESSRNYESAVNNYKQLKDKQKELADSLSNVEITRFSTLKQEMKNLGLEE